MIQISLITTIIIIILACTLFYFVKHQNFLSEPYNDAVIEIIYLTLAGIAWYQASTYVFHLDPWIATPTLFIGFFIWYKIIMYAIH